jgi:predicted TIM-barrel fold metal-dependent hydrolase
VNAVADRTVSGERIPVPNSSGTEPPHVAAPAGATDCHHHIFDVRFPMVNHKMRAIATTADYMLLKRRLGLSRSVVTAPSTYEYDNSCLLDALDTFGDVARGVAIVRPTVTDAELKGLHLRRVRGIRVYLEKMQPPLTADELLGLGRRAADLNWQIEIMPSRGDKLVEAEAVLAQLPCNIVIDHLGYTPQPAGASHPVFATMLRLLESGRTWIKLSGPYFTSQEGYPNYADVDGVATRLVEAAPERMLWGTDWPHGGEKTKPDDAILLDRLSVWAGRERDRILVDNPSRLYWAD